MMSGRYLLDTNIIIAIFAEEESIAVKLAQADEVFIPSIALGELYYGARSSGRPEANIERVNELAANCAVLACDAETARHYGIVKSVLRVKGKPLPENDIWVASLAIQHNLTVVSRDGHFYEVDSLDIESW